MEEHWQIYKRNEGQQRKRDAKQPPQPERAKPDGDVERQKDAQRTGYAQEESGIIERAAPESAIRKNGKKRKRHGNKQADVGQQQAQAKSPLMDISFHIARFVAWTRFVAWSGRGDGIQNDGRKEMSALISHLNTSFPIPFAS
ncbi:MAG: hypothetical protein ACI4RA_00655 [Kiritimatiellia bacterium]